MYYPCVEFVRFQDDSQKTCVLFEHVLALVGDVEEAGKNVEWPQSILFLVWTRGSAYLAEIMEELCFIVSSVV